METENDLKIASGHRIEALRMFVISRLIEIPVHVILPNVAFLKRPDAVASNGGGIVF